MALYSYQALARDGKKVAGQVDSSSVQAAREAVVKMGLYPIKIETFKGVPWSFKTLFSRSLDIKEKIFFTKQLSLLLKSGVPLLQALELLVDQSEGYLHTIIVSLKDDI